MPPRTYLVGRGRERERRGEGVTEGGSLVERATKAPEEVGHGTQYQTERECRHTRTHAHAHTCASTDSSGTVLSLLFSESSANNGAEQHAHAWRDAQEQRQ